MSKLSRDARDLIEAARAGESALAAERGEARARVRARVLARVSVGVAVGSATALGTSSTAAKTALSAGLLFKCAAAVGVASVVVAVAVAGGFVPGAPAGALPSAVAVRAVAPRGSAVIPPQAPAEPVAVAPAEPAPSASVPRATAPAVPHASVRPTSSLEAETALLERAQADLRAGHPDRALAALDEVKGGALREEQRAARVLALCAAGRTAEARSEAARFLAESPRSPMAERVRSSCAGRDDAPARDGGVP